MADKHISPGIAALRKLESVLQREGRTRKRRRARAIPPMFAVLWKRVSPFLRRPWLRRSLIGAGAAIAIVCLVFAGLWWRLASGPIEFDVATPWLTAAIEDNFGKNYKVQVGGTQLERDEGGRIRLRLRDIVVRDADGAVAASAPKAEVGFSSNTLLTGRVRAERLSLVGAEISVRIEPNGNVTVFAGTDKHPIATTSVVPAGVGAEAARDAQVQPGPADTALHAPPKNIIENLNALLGWIDSLGASGLDGHDLAELGLKNGNLIVDDQRNGKRWKFEDIDVSLMRAKGGNIVFKVESGSEDQPWSLSAAVAPLRSGRRVFNVEARRVMAKDLLLALRLGDDPLMARVPISASIRAEIDAEGMTQSLQGRIIADAGPLTETADPEAGLSIDRAEFNLEWDAARRVLVVPFQIVSGGTRMTLFARIEPPRTQDPQWNVVMTGGTVVLGIGSEKGAPLVFNHILVRARIDTQQRRLVIEQGDLANVEVGVALTGNVDFSTPDPRLTIGVAGTRMPLSAGKRLWPTFVNPLVRAWVAEHVLSGTVERVVIATNAHLSAFKRGGPPVPDDGLSIEIVGNGATLRPLETLPAIEDAEVTVRVTGRYAAVSVNKGTVGLPSGRRLTVANGLFEVPDYEVPQPPARTRFRLEGPVPVVGELLETERLREYSSMPFDITTAKGNVFAQVSLAFPLKPDLPPGSSTFIVTADIANFAAEKMIMGQKVEAAALRINANNQGYQIRGDTKIAGAAATLDYRKSKADSDAEVRIQSTLDDGARARLGFDMGNALVGPVPVKVTGSVGSTEKDSRFIVDADLTPARVDNLLPGWSKPAGKAVRANFAMIMGKSTRFENLSIDGAGLQVKGSVELDHAGDIVTANFPVFALAEGDKVAFKAEKAADGAMRVTLRGDVHDGRSFIKSSMAGARSDPRGKNPVDLDLDVRIATVLGFNGETLRNLELKLSRRGGQIRSFGMNARLGRDAQLAGDLRRKPKGGNVLYFETRDAGSLFRFIDSYARMNGGLMWVAMDAPTAQAAPQEGLLAISDFSIRGEAALDRVVSGAPGNAQREGVRFSRMRAEFTRLPGRLEIRDGVVQGNIGATIDGQIDYFADEVHLRGSFVPLYQLNNMLGNIPIVGLFLGGGNEGLLGVTYEVVGPPNAPRLNVNPLSAVAPGLLRKMFEFRNAPQDRGFEALR